MKKLTLATMLAVSGFAYAGIEATPLWITLQPGSVSSDGTSANIANITVTNTDTAANAYVQSTILKVQKIGDPTSPTVTFNPGDNPQQFGLLVSPTKFAIKPGSSVTIRVTNLNLNPTTDSLYTILFTPVSSPSAAAAPAATAPNSKVGIDMNLVLSYKAQVFVLPENINMHVCAKAKGTNVSISNQGNSFIQLLGGQLCDATGKNCTAFSKYDYQIIPAGGNLTIETPTAGILNYTGKYGKGLTTNLSTANPC